MYTLTNSKEEAEEVLINGFVKGFSKIDSHTAEGNFEGWMRRIFFRAALNYRKKFKLKWTRYSLLEIDAWVKETDYFETDYLLKKLQSFQRGTKKFSPYLP